MSREPQHPPELDDQERHLLLHALGFQQVAAKWKPGGWRNRFVADSGSEDCKVLKRLVARGWAHERAGQDGYVVFSVTEAGQAVFKARGWPWAEE
jgi:hypothetical protein